MPPKPKRSKSPDSRFMFVNEDASTVSQKTKDVALDRTKQSHVQRQNFARKRRMQGGSSVDTLQNRSQISASPAPALTGPPAGVSSSSERITSYEPEYFDVLHNLDLGGAPSISPSPPQIGLLDPRLFVDPFNPSQSPSRVSLSKEDVQGSPRVYRPGHFFEAPAQSQKVTSSPRNATIPVIESAMFATGSPTPTIRNTRQPLDEWAPALIRYYNTVILPEQFWMELRKVPLSHIRHAPSIHTDMQSCMSEPSHMYAFLASAATQMIEREGEILVRDATGEDVQRVPSYFKTKAIRALRVKLGSSSLDHSIAVDVHRLYMTTLYSEAYETAEPHFQALLSMVETLGGLDTFNDYQLESIAHTVCYTALETLEPPRLLATWDPGPLSEEQLLAIDQHVRLHEHPASRFHKALASTNGSSISKALPDLVEVLKMSNHLIALPQYLPDYHKWLTRRRYALLHHFLSIRSNHEIDPIQDSLRIATIYWLAISSYPARGRVCASLSTHVLKERLEESSLHSLWHSHPDCLLWVAVFGGMCAIHDGDELEFYVDLARNAAVEAGVTNFHELEDLLSTFLYDPNSQQDMLKEFSRRIWVH
ncbi:uncharacterized protein A1O9_02899 [Exophiala aquamarina CBS 119918]|uniref:Transcription factor domain-containing protein n=1 Tax=Exophiala aquamarina CBS 119918 TaxID=1182545 RepID=A0A072PPT6_9EURO|nr:uncharacterized protein A1O9_02899 [Exophiala aquamarina CBS 119918]KEF61333.1 hypothetical protein A1O9_02899 [Exophiala aquamarina CBS 119918]